MRPVLKAFAYLTRGGEVLVFRHVDFPEAGVQVPSGSVRRGETPKAAALREAADETGLAGLAVRGALGVRDADMRPFGKLETHRRHFFHVTLGGAAPERWLRKRFEFFWTPFGEAAGLLAAGHGEMLSRLRAPEDGARHLARVRAVVAGLAGASERVSHGEPTFFVAGKVFAMFANNHHYDGRIAVWLPVDAAEQEAAIEEAPARYFRPPYVGAAGWLGVDLDRAGDEELAARLEAAWRRIGARGKR